MPSRRERIVLIALVATHVAIYLTICTIKYRWYLYRDFDLAIFVQAMHGMLRGEWFSSIRGMHWLGDHSSLILIPLLPLFAVAPHPLTLLAVQTLALGLGALPVWALARRELPAGPMPLACAALWLLHPALGYLNLFEFHPETLATPLLLWCALEVRAGRGRRAAIAAAIALLAREDVALPVLGLAAVAALGRPRQPRLAAGLAGLAALSLAVTFAVLKPWLLAGQAEYAQMYAAWGRTPLEVVAGILTRPHEAIAALFSTPGNPADTALKQELWVHLFAPVAGLAALAPLWLLPALPVLVEHLLAGRTHQHTIVFQYTALSLPFVVFAAVIGAKRVADRLGPRVLIAGLAIVVAGCHFVFGPLRERGPWQRSARNEPIFADGFERAMKPWRDRMVARLPREGAVIAGFEFLPRLASRRDLHSLHHVITGRYTFSTRPYPVPAGARAILGDMSSQIPNLNFGSAGRLRAAAAPHALAPAAAAGGTILLLEGARDSVELYRVGAEWRHDQALGLVADEQLFLFGAERLDSVIAPGGVVRIATTWKRVAEPNRSYLSQAWLTRGNQPVLYGRARALAYGLLPPADWPPDANVRETYHLLIPDDFPPGRYRPVFRLISVDADGRQEIPLVQVGELRERMNGVGIAEIEVVPKR